MLQFKTGLICQSYIRKYTGIRCENVAQNLNYWGIELHCSYISSVAQIYYRTSTAQSLQTYVCEMEELSRINTYLNMSSLKNKTNSSLFL